MHFSYFLRHFMVAFFFVIGTTDPVTAITVITVDQSGHGDFTKVKQAVDSVPPNNKAWIRIHVKPGIYNEKVEIPMTKPFLILEGEGSKSTIIQYGDTGPVYKSWTFKVSAENFVARDITFRNSYGQALPRDTNLVKPEWTPAILIDADKAAFYRCGFVGIQDTLTDWTGRHYFKSCYIEGVIDFIWGQGQSIYEECVINVNDATIPRQVGCITAQSREQPTATNGFVFKKCVVQGTGSAYLGRAHGPYARVLFYKTTLTSIIVPEGWDAWNSAGHEQTITFAEDTCTGPGANKSKRVKWEKTLSANDLHNLVDINTFVNADRWIEKQPYHL